jgi:hypothetical protein
VGGEQAAICIEVLYYHPSYAHLLQMKVAPFIQSEGKLQLFLRCTCSPLCSLTYFVCIGTGEIQ